MVAFLLPFDKIFNILRQLLTAHHASSAHQMGPKRRPKQEEDAKNKILLQCTVVHIYGQEVS